MSTESSSDESVEETRRKAAKWTAHLLSSKGSADSTEISDYKTTEFSTTSLTGRRQIDPNKQVTVSRSVADQSAGRQANEKTNKNKSPSQQKKANCGQCKKAIYDEQPMRFDSKAYHRFCFRCSSCNAQLDNVSNAAYLCEAEQRFYCIRCCDCKCWLTNASKTDKESTDKEPAADKEPVQKADHHVQTETGLNENKLISSKSLTSRALSPPLPARQPERVKPTQSADTSKKCKFCNQILPDYRQDSQQTEPFAIIDRQATAEQTGEQTTAQATEQTVAQTDARLNYQLNYKTQINKPKLDFRQSGEPVDSWPAGRLNQLTARRSPNRTQQENQRIRLAKRPTVGPRIARIIDKLENSLNLKTQTERNFQENFFRDVEQNGKEENLAGEKNDNSVGRLNLRENLPEDLPNGQLKEQQKLGNKLEQNQDLYPVQSPSNRRPVVIEHNELSNAKLNRRQSIACPNCKKVLPTSLFERGACRPFCTVHCPVELEESSVRGTDKTVSRAMSPQKAMENPANHLSSKSNLRHRIRSDLPSIRSVDEHYSRPSLSLPSTRGLPVVNRLESKKKPSREPTEDAKQSRMQPAMQSVMQPVIKPMIQPMIKPMIQPMMQPAKQYAKQSLKPNLPSDPHLADQSTTGICCKCGLRVRFNELANPPPSKCLRCSACGGPLSPGRHSPSAPGRLQRADSYAFNVKHT